MHRKYLVPTFKKSLFKTVIDIRIYDINYGNHLGHDRLVSILHEARMQLLKNAGYTEFVAKDLVTLITTIVVNYKGQGFYGDKLLIEIGMGEIYNSSLELIYQVHTEDKNRQIANALTMLTFYDIKAAKVVSIPEKFLADIGVD